MIGKFDEILIKQVNYNGRFIYDDNPSTYLHIEGRRASFFKEIAKLIEKELHQEVLGKSPEKRTTKLQLSRCIN